MLTPSSSQHADTLNDLTVTYTYDLFNRLISTKNGKKTVRFTYEADGYRHSKATITPSSEETIIYFYEGDHVAFETDETGKVIALDHYGTSQYARTIYEDGEETTFYYQFNAYGDVTALIGTDGNTIAKYEYDAFGNLTSQPDAKVNNSITYRGYEYDAETGLYYLNARYYDSDTARFLTEDTYRGEKNDPLSLNLYTYCKNNPLKYTDPTGHNSVDLGYVSGSYKLSEKAQKEKAKREQQLNEDLHKLGEGVILAIIGVAVMAATGGTAAPIVIMAELAFGGATLGFGMSDLAQGVDGVTKYYTTDGIYTSDNPVRDLLLNGDEYAYQNAEVFTVSMAGLSATSGDALLEWLNSATKYTANRVGEFLKTPFVNRASSTPTLLYGAESVEDGINSGSPMFGDEWYTYLCDKYGANNVTWESVDINDIIDMPSKVSIFTPEQISDMALKSSWSVDPLGKGSLKGIPYDQGGGMSMHAPNGSSLYIQYHPGGGHHGESPYFKVSSGAYGTKRFFINRIEVGHSNGKR